MAHACIQAMPFRATSPMKRANISHLRHRNMRLRDFRTIFASDRRIQGYYTVRLWHLAPLLLQQAPTISDLNHPSDRIVQGTAFQDNTDGSSHIPVTIALHLSSRSVAYVKAILTAS